MSKHIFVCIYRVPWVTIRHEYMGPRTYQLPHSTAVRDVKQLIYEETDLPITEQQLIHNGKVVRHKEPVSAMESQLEIWLT